MHTRRKTMTLRTLTLGSMCLLALLILFNAGMGLYSVNRASGDFLEVIEEFDRMSLPAVQAQADITDVQFNHQSLTTIDSLTSKMDSTAVEAYKEAAGIADESLTIE